MNGILSNWKRDGVFTISQTEKTKDAVESIADYNLEYDRRRKIALSKANKNLEKAMEIKGFSEIYSRLNGIEKDLAFAEIANNESMLSTLETEKSILTVNAENLLKSIGLSLIDLSPRYACEKCKDTGYIGTNRCDCFDKKPQ
jgi:DNA replication protein DnaC